MFSLKLSREPGRNDSAWLWREAGRSAFASGPERRLYVGCVVRIDDIYVQQRVSIHPILPGGENLGLNKENLTLESRSIVCGRGKAEVLA